MYMVSGPGFSFSLPLTEGEGWSRRRDVDKGFEEGRRAPLAIRRMAQVR